MEQENTTDPSQALNTELLNRNTTVLSNAIGLAVAVMSNLNTDALPDPKDTPSFTSEALTAAVAARLKTKLKIEG